MCSRHQFTVSHFQTWRVLYERDSIVLAPLVSVHSPACMLIHEANLCTEESNTTVIRVAEILLDQNYKI